MEKYIEWIIWGKYVWDKKQHGTKVKILKEKIEEQNKKNYELIYSEIIKLIQQQKITYN